MFCKLQVILESKKIYANEHLVGHCWPLAKGILSISPVKRILVNAGFLTFQGY